MKNLIPEHGEAYYIPAFLNEQEAASYFEILAGELPWQSDIVTLYGKTIYTKRQVAFFGDKPFAYTYSRHTRTALPWTESLLFLKKHIEERFKECFNCCLANYYPDGKTGMGWHSDDESELDELASIASISLGASRRFKFKHKKTGDTIKLTLDSGSLLLMKSPLQNYWQHALMATQKKVSPRINLTFRLMKTD